MDSLENLPPAADLTRRDFVRSALTCAAAGAGAAALGGSPSRLLAATDSPAGRQPGQPAFPADFSWGVATSAFQVEGATSADGRKPSIWDTFCRTPGKILDGTNADVTCDHYHRFRDDVKLMADLGVRHYRFSIAWPRVLPDGRGTVNERGLDFYKRLIDCLGEHGIAPHATLYHWDCPQALEDEYGSWRSRRIADDFAEYAGAVASRLGDRVQDWITLNEVATFAIFCGYGVGRPGTHAPGHALARRKDQTTITHHALLAHGRACQALRASSPRPCRVSLAEVPVSCVPVIETPEHIAAANRAFREEPVNGAILVPLLTGRYDASWLERLGAEAPDIHNGDLEVIAQPLDSIGLNCYTGNYVRAADNASGYEVIRYDASYPSMHLPWLHFIPEAMYWMLRQVENLCGPRVLPMYVTENGCPGTDELTSAGDVLDTDRVMFLRAYVRQLQRAVAEGVPVRGYFAWSLLDNFEWAEGLRKRFGLVHVDYATQRRTPKLSYGWFRETIRTGRVT